MLSSSLVVLNLLVYYQLVYRLLVYSQLVYSFTINSSTRLLSTCLLVYYQLVNFHSFQLLLEDGNNFEVCKKNIKKTCRNKENVLILQCKRCRLRWQMLSTR